MKLEEIKKDLMTLQGKYFGVYDAIPKKEDSMEIQFINFLIDGLEEVNPFKDGKDLEDWIFEEWNDEEDGIIEELQTGNSFNWNSRVVFQYREFRFNDEVYTGIAFHRYGDVRGNYTGYAIFKMNCESFLDAICEFEYYIPCKDENWSIRFGILEELGYIHAFNYTTNEYYDGYYWKDESPNEVKKAVEEWM